MRWIQTLNPQVVEPERTQSMEKVRLGLLRNESDSDHVLWLRAYDDRRDRIDLSVIDLSRSDWLDRVRDDGFDAFLSVPPGVTAAFKLLYDERIRILASLDIAPIYPSPEEIYIYENKRYLSYWLRAHGVPHARTWVFYSESEAMDFLERAGFPLVGKLSIGASGSGVTVLASPSEASYYVRAIFSGKGVTRTSGPKWRRKGFFGRLARGVMQPGVLRSKLKRYRDIREDVQTDFVLLQEFVPHSFEWRGVRIGDSFFAHKKIVENRMASGSLLKQYEDPPRELLDFVKEITDRHEFYSQAIDIFESAGQDYLVNEMQCIFGQSDPHQMLVNGRPGRYLHSGEGWVFEEGDFNRHESFLLRLDYVLERLSSVER